MLGQQATEEKSNEITAIPLLLKALDLTGALVTIDAMGTQTRIAQATRPHDSKIKCPALTAAQGGYGPITAPQQATIIGVNCR